MPALSPDGDRYGSCPLAWMEGVHRMSETTPATSLRPTVGTPLYEPVGRAGVPAAAGMPVSHPNHPVLLPIDDGEDDPLPLPPPRLAPASRWYDGLAKPSAYVASGLAGAVLGTPVYGLVGPPPPPRGDTETHR